MGYRTDYITRAMKFIQQIDKYLTGCHSFYDYTHAVNAFNVDHKRNVIIESGLTRVCLLTSDYVIKINCGSSNNLSTFGDCDVECKFYEFAESEGMEYLLAKITKVEYCSHAYYIMPRINNVGTGGADVEDYLDSDEADWVSAHLYDMHDGNYGFDDITEDPIIIDYACVKSFEHYEG